MEMQVFRVWYSKTWAAIEIKFWLLQTSERTCQNQACKLLSKGPETRQDLCNYFFLS